MKLLLADPNRDLLSGYKKLLELRGHSVRTAFDGTQVLTLLGETKFDLAILNERLPRVGHDQMVRNLREEGIPVLVLLDSPLNTKTLLRTELANAYLPFPFSPGELSALMENVLGKVRSTGTLECMGVRVDVPAFCFSSTRVRLTAGEMDVLEKLSRRERLAGSGNGVWVHSLNQKLDRLRQRVRIAYTAEKGYRMVSAYES